MIHETSAMHDFTAHVAQPIEPERMGAKFPDFDDDSAGAMFASVMALVLAFMAVASRAGFQDMLIQPVVRSLGLSWLLLHFGWCVRGTARRVETRRRQIPGTRSALPRTPELTDTSADEPWWLSSAAVTLGCLAILFALGQLTGHFDWTFSHWLAYGGFALGGLRALTALSKLPGRVWQTAGLAAVAVFLGVYSAGAIWGSGYQNPLFVEQLAQETANIDTLFHAALCNMIRTHGVPSTGLDGTPFLPYHFGSHWLFAQICNLLDVSVIDFYNVGYPVIFAPFGVYCLLTFAREVGCGPASTLALPAQSAQDASDAGPGIAKRTRSQWLFWFVLCLGYIGFLPLDAGFETPTARTSIFVSESYAVAIALAFLGLSITVRLVRETQRAQHGGGGPKFVVAGIVLPLLLAVICLCKISIFLLLAVAGMYGFARLRLYRSWVFITMAMASLICGGFAFRFSYAPGYEAETGWVPFGFLRANVEPQWWGLFWLCYFAWGWVLIVMRCRDRRISTLAELSTALRRGELLDIELVFVIATAGIAPGLLINQWSSMHYFSEYQQWVALGLVLGMLARVERGPRAEAWSPKTSETALSLRQVAVVGLCSIAAATMFLNTAALLRQTLAINLASRGFPEGGTGIGVKFMAGRFGDAWETLARQTRELESGGRSPQIALVKQLRTLDRLKRPAKRSSALFVPRSNRVYWELLSTPYTPQDIPLVGPALTGMALVDGLYDPPDGDRWVGYGYQEYPRPPTKGSPPHFDVGDPDLCERVKNLGFHQLVEVTAVRDGERTEIRTHVVGCR